MTQGESRKRQAGEVGLTILVVLLLHGLFWAFSDLDWNSPNPYNSYSKQCVAWLQGRLDLGQDYPWLELAVYQGKYYVSFPPFPSYVLLPFAAIWGENTPDGLVALLSVAVGTGYAWAIGTRCSLPVFQRMFLPVFLYGGTGVWQITVDGSVWFLAQNFALTLTLMSFYYGLQGRRGTAVFCLACAVGCRPFQLLYLPLVGYLLWKRLGECPGRQRLRQLLWEKWWVYLPGLLLGISYMALNVLRFGNPFEFGHNYLPEFVHSSEGQFSLSYVGQNVSSLFRLPTWDRETGVVEFPYFNGMHIFLSFPIVLWYLYRLAAVGRGWLSPMAGGRALHLMAGCLLLVHLFCILCHKTMGGYHFGNRYLADLLPCLFLSLAALPQSQLSRKGELFQISEGVFLQGLFLVGLLVNFCGVLVYYGTWEL